MCSFDNHLTMYHMQPKAHRRGLFQRTPNRMCNRTCVPQEAAIFIFNARKRSCAGRKPCLKCDVRCHPHAVLSLLPVVFMLSDTPHQSCRIHRLVRAWVPLCWLIGLFSAQALNECTEWGQIFILDSLAIYVPEDQRELQSICERVAPRLQHVNAAVVLSAVKVCMACF